jgi:hypothetical protein
MPVMRYLPQQASIPRLAASLPLKVLLTAAQTSPPITYESELGAIQAAFAGMSDFVQVTVEPHLTARKLLRLMRQEFHVWHFVGHGNISEDGKTGQLCFEDEFRDVEWVSAPQIAVLLNRSGVRLAVLSGCHTASIPTDSVRSVALALVRAGVPAVVAQQFTVPEGTTRAFATEFYQALVEGFPIDACVTEGRKAIMNSIGLGQPDWGIPVIYTRTSDGMLFDLPPLPKPHCPYPGMVAFRVEDAPLFYGREPEIQQMMHHLRYQRSLFVIGPSGSGKSSLVYAGLLPHLARSSLFPQDFWLVRAARPGARSLEALSAELGGEITQPARAVSSLLDQHRPAQRLLLVIDQFEELFVLSSPADQRTFVAVLQSLYACENCAVLIVLRADFYPDLMTSELWPVDPRQRLEVAPLRGERLRQAIEQPSTDVGVRLEPALIAQLLADASNEPGVLPLIQETMVLLWDRMPRRLLTRDAYTQLGRDGHSGITTAIATKADAVLANLTPEQQIIARRIVLRLIQFGEGRADTRRQQPVSALRTMSDDDELFEKTLRHLTHNRLLTLSGELGSLHKRVDIAHEALIVGWPTAQQWITERRDAEQTRRRLEEKAAEWARLGCGSSGLLDEVELREAARWLDSPDAFDLGYSDDLLALVRTSRTAIEQTERNRELARQREVDQERAVMEAERERARVQQAYCMTHISSDYHNSTQAASQERRKPGNRF